MSRREAYGVRRQHLRFFLPILLITTLVAATPEQGTPVYGDPSAAVEDRVADLLSRMTLAEKIGQMTQINLTRLTGSGEWDRGELNEEWLERLLVEVGAGSLLSGGGAAPVPNTAQGWARTINELQRYALEHTRLRIPLLYGTDAVHGHNNLAGATIYPHNIGLAASFDRELVREIAAATASDAAATGVSWNFAPVADLGTDPRWGRFYETFGEDPLLAAELTGAHVIGQQRSARLASTLKHFVGYGQAPSGNDRAPAQLTMQALRELHLPPFAAGIEAGAQTVMVNSGSLNSVPVHASRYLLTELLRGELGFEGPVLSDWADVDKLVTVHRVARDMTEAVAMAVNAGVDVVMVPHDGEGFSAALQRAVQSGSVSPARIDEAVSRILELKFRLGLFEEPYVDEDGAARSAEPDLPLARRAALSSITLLKNRSDALPLTEQRIVVTGAAADDAAIQLGGWTVEWQGLPAGTPEVPVTTTLAGIVAGAPAGTVVEYLPFPSVAEGEALAGSEAVVLVLGEPPYAEGQGDSDMLLLPEAQLEQSLALVRAMDESSKLVIVLFAGRPLAFPDWLLESADAVVMAYLPGSEGGSAVADILFGFANPSGRLPFSWPRSAGQLPLDTRALPQENGDEPLYRFGHGLSYTNFRYRNLRSLGSDSEGLHLAVDVENSGERAGDIPVLAYAYFPLLARLVPNGSLAAFDRVHLEPGELREVSLVVPWEALALVGGDVQSEAAAHVAPGEYSFQVGGARTRLSLPGCAPSVGDCR